MVRSMNGCDRVCKRVVLLIAYPVDSGFTGKIYRKVLENKLRGCIRKRGDKYV
jgi:hypothetical protein